MIRITDDRLGSEVHLCSLMAGDTFMWRDYPCIWIDMGTMKWEGDPNKLPCMTLTSGEFFELDRLSYVTPIKCELTITE